MTKTADEVWAEVVAEVEAMHAAFGSQRDPDVATLAFDGEHFTWPDRRVKSLCRIFAATGYRLAMTECADRIEKAATR